MKLTQPIKWHGGKHYLAPKIIALMPPRCQKPNKPAPDDRGWLHYVEPYFGGGSVLLANDPEGISEVVNDIHGPLTNFWKCLAEPRHFAEFAGFAEAIPFCESTFDCALAKIARPCDTPDEICPSCALAFFVACRQSLAGRMKGFAGITRNRTRKGMNEQVSAWLNTIEGLPAVHERLKRVLILNDDALAVIRKEDVPRTLFYLDPPYLHETRATTGEYAHEMTEDDHTQLLRTLTTIKGRFLLSGYKSTLYLDFAATWRWNRHDFNLPNNSAGGNKKQRKVECVWANY